MLKDSHWNDISPASVKSSSRRGRSRWRWSELKAWQHAKRDTRKMKVTQRESREQIDGREKKWQCGAKTKKHDGEANEGKEEKGVAFTAFWSSYFNQMLNIMEESGVISNQACLEWFILNLEDLFFKLISLGKWEQCYSNLVPSWYQTTVWKLLIFVLISERFGLFVYANVTTPFQWASNPARASDKKKH